MGGTGRLLMGAFTLAVGGNVTGGVGQLLQSTVVNTLQGLGAQQIKLIADSMKSEVARTALQGILAGAGAAAQGQSATSAALGASASVVLNNLIDSAYGESSSALSLEEREARKNLVTTLITGTAHALGGDAALANAAATIEAENNAAWVPLITGAYWVADKALTAYYIHQDVTALRSGEKTLEQIALERGEQYIVGALVGNLAGHGYKAVKQGGKWVAKAVKVAAEGAEHRQELATATAGISQFSRQTRQVAAKNLHASKSGGVTGSLLGQKTVIKSQGSLGKATYSDGIKHTYSSIKNAPLYPKGFKTVQNGVKRSNINKLSALEDLRKIEPGQWKKVYRDGFDAHGKKISIHYFESKSGRVFNVKIKPEWSNI